MAKTPEGQVKEYVKRVLKNAEAYYEMYVPCGYGRPSLDFVGCLNGHYFAVETKAGKKDMTPRQKATARLMRAAGAAVFLVNEDTMTREEFERWIHKHRCRSA